MPVTINGNGTVTGLTALPDSAMSSGSIIQVVQAYKTDTFSASLATGVYSSAILTQSITPSSASSKILVLCTLHLTTGGDTGACGAKIQRDGSDIGVADADGNRSRGIGGGVGGLITGRLVSNIQMTLLDSPNSTSALSYTTLAKHGYSGTQTIYINRELTDDNSSRATRFTSSLTLMEVAA